MVETPAAGVKGTPDERLAHEIVGNLVAAKLITAEQGAKLLPKILAGRPTSEEWSSLFDLARLASSEGRTS